MSTRALYMSHAELKDTLVYSGSQDLIAEVFSIEHGRNVAFFFVDVKLRSEHSFRLSQDEYTVNSGFVPFVKQFADRFQLIIS